MPKKSKEATSTTATGSTLDWVRQNQSSTAVSRCAACACPGAAQELQNILVAMAENRAHDVTTERIDERLREVDEEYRAKAKATTLSRHLEKHVRELWRAAKGLS